jgi:hypothetical protein
LGEYALCQGLKRYCVPLGPRLAEPDGPEEFTVVFLGGFDDALLDETLSAEGGYEGVVLAA